MRVSLPVLSGKILSMILVVNDGSTDKTNDIVATMSTRKFQPFNCLIMNRITEKGSWSSGMLKAKGQYRLFTDADNATSIDHLEKMMPFFNQGYDVIIGSYSFKREHCS